MFFSTVGIVARKQAEQTVPIVRQVVALLERLGISPVVDSDSFHLPEHEPYCASYAEVLEQADMIISIGGDGTLLNVVRDMAHKPLPLIGINLGRLGFLVDITEENLDRELQRIIAGSYELDERMLLMGRVARKRGCTLEAVALNDLVLCKTSSSRMIEVECFVNDRFFSTQRADGIIFSTPTGSTAYSLSAGGPILMPDLDAISITSICPHTMGQRPVVIASDAVIKIGIVGGTVSEAQLSCDGHSAGTIAPGDVVTITCHTQKAMILHPKGHDHFQTLRQKLHWGNKL